MEKFYTLSFADNLPEPDLVGHDSIADAEHFARDLADEGYVCQILYVSAELYPSTPSKTLEEYYGVKPGIDFPATL